MAGHTKVTLSSPAAAALPAGRTCTFLYIGFCLLPVVVAHPWGPSRGSRQWPEVTLSRLLPGYPPPVCAPGGGVCCREVGAGRTGEGAWPGAEKGPHKRSMTVAAAKSPAESRHGTERGVQRPLPAPQSKKIISPGRAGDPTNSLYFRPRLVRRLAGHIVDSLHIFEDYIVRTVLQNVVHHASQRPA